MTTLRRYEYPLHLREVEKNTMSISEEVDKRVRGYMERYNIKDYPEALQAVLNEDEDLKRRYALGEGKTERSYTQEKGKAGIEFENKIKDYMRTFRVRRTEAQEMVVSDFPELTKKYLEEG